MPDNGILGGLADYLQGIGSAVSPNLQENMFRQRARDALARQTSPDDADILMGNLPAYGLGFQRNLFINQLQDLMGPDPNHPRMGLNEALYHLSNPKEQYGVNFGPPVEAGSVKVPTVYGQGQPPHLFTGMGGPPMTAGPGTGGGPAVPAPTSSQQSTPSVTPNSGLDNLAAIAARYKGMEAEAEAKGKGAGGLQPGFPAALVKAHNAISQIDDILNDPRLESVTGRVAGGLPARYSAAPDLVNAIESANNVLLNDTLTSVRNVTGRPVNAGTLKEIRPFDLSADRLGGVESLKADLNRAKKTIQDETDAAWVGSNSPPEFKPVWGQPSAGPQSTAQPNDRHIQYLRANPGTAVDFDKKFGKGASQKVLGNAQHL